MASGIDETIEFTIRPIKPGPMCRSAKTGKMVSETIPLNVVTLVFNDLTSLFLNAKLLMSGQPARRRWRHRRLISFTENRGNQDRFDSAVNDEN